MPIYLKNISKGYFFLLLFMVILIYEGSNTLELIAKKIIPSLAIENDLQGIKKKGTLIAYTDYSSTSYFLYKGEPMGFHYELLKLFAKSQQLDLAIKPIESLSKALTSLQQHEYHILAMGLTKMPQRADNIVFTEPLIQTNEVLIQQKKGNKSTHSYINNLKQLNNQYIFIPQRSSFHRHLNILAKKHHITLHIVPTPYSQEFLIDLVAQGKIKYAVADEHIARINSYYFNNIDVNTIITKNTQLAWAVHADSKELLDALNKWISQIERTPMYTYIFSKYFKYYYTAKYRLQNEYHSMNKQKISRFDHLIKKHARTINWDWRLLASLICQESKFETDTTSMAGAYGLMQLIPETALTYGVDQFSSEDDQIRAGVEFIKWLEDKLQDKIPDPIERQKFILASYNAGLGHILDARRLATKYHKNQNIWDKNVGDCIILKGDPKHFKDAAIKYGPSKGKQTHNYVKSIWKRYQHYKNLIPE